jgi:hypothetical protein
VPVLDPSFRIVGVIRDAANRSPQERAAPQVLVPFTLRGPASLAFVIRASADPLRLLNTVRGELQQVNRDVALLEPSTMEDLIERVFYARPRFSLLVLAIFACTGMALVTSGVYGVLAYTVSQQTREIAIRMALGSERNRVVRMVLRLGLRLVGAGIVIGAAASVATNRLLVTQLWNTSPADPLTFGIAILALVAVGGLACWIPARRAVRIEPMVALRHE